MVTGEQEAETDGGKWVSTAGKEVGRVGRGVSQTCLVRRGAGLLGALPLAGTLSWSRGCSRSSALRVGNVS